MNKLRKKAQEEMVGFGLIVMIIAVIILVVLGLMLRGGNEREVESYEINSFIDSMLEYTTECEDNSGFPIALRNLIRKCTNKDVCSNNLDSCEVLNSTIRGILEKSWQTGEDRPVKGYEINITTASGMDIFSEKKGNITHNSKTGFQDISSAQIKLNIYY